MSPHSAHPRARRARLVLWRSRHLVTAACCALALGQVVHALAPAPPASRPAVVADHQVAAGTVLGPDDVHVADLPVVAVPEGAPSTLDDVVGRTAAVVLVPGQVVLPALVGGGELATSGPAGTVVVPVRLQDPAVVAVLSVGDRIDLVATGLGPGTQPPAYLARRATVVATPTTGGGDQPLLGADTSGTPLVLVATTPDDAAAVARASSDGGLAAVVVP